VGIEKMQPSDEVLDKGSKRYFIYTYNVPEKKQTTCPFWLSRGGRGA